eukprot:70312_1
MAQMLRPQLQPLGLKAETCCPSAMACSLAVVRVLDQKDPTYLRNIFSLEIHLNAVIGQIADRDYFYFSANTWDSNYTEKYWTFTLRATTWDTIFNAWQNHPTDLFKSRAFVADIREKGWKPHQTHVLSISGIKQSWNKDPSSGERHCVVTVNAFDSQIHKMRNNKPSDFIEWVEIIPHQHASVDERISWRVQRLYANPKVLYQPVLVYTSLFRKYIDPYRNRCFLNLMNSNDANHRIFELRRVIRQHVEFGEYFDRKNPLIGVLFFHLSLMFEETWKALSTQDHTTFSQVENEVEYNNSALDLLFQSGDEYKCVYDWCRTMLTNYFIVISFEDEDEDLDLNLEPLIRLPPAKMCGDVNCDLLRITTPSYVPGKGDLKPACSLDIIDEYAAYVSNNMNPAVATGNQQSEETGTWCGNCGSIHLFFGNLNAYHFMIGIAILTQFEMILTVISMLFVILMLLVHEYGYH